MQSHDWNDIRYLLALYRTGKLKDAGRAVGTSETTVARRIKKLEQDLGASLFLQSANGRYEPTDAALQIMSHAEAIELESLAIREKSDEVAQQVLGSVRISSVPIIVNRVLVPNLGSLTRKHPHLTVELVPASGNLDLSKREADLAVRFARPAGGGLRIKAQKLGEMKFGPYSASSVTPDQLATLGWITYDETHSELPQARWLEVAANSSPEARACLKVADAETALEAVANGAGKSLLPQAIAETDPRLRSLSLTRDAAPPAREVWLLAHVDQTSRSSIIAAKEWLASLPWI
ncbi:hypothetical protein NTH_02327 [Nitratireductor thuwali]|uniref:HTH lysR-type domain-containing protein n=2 Tax=Nitratireductor thuwali TaxID=2267699 RepID=A0ABY5MKU2_9HYPH|nr:hypothetical protein NTH_02327 [Nitratireductor thuwali]